jgi:hypothetical protein
VNSEVYQGNPKDMLQHVMTSFQSWLQDCIEQYGAYLQSVIFKY